jgi:two-component sensor histidine kinase
MAQHDSSVLILAPLGRDAEVAAAILNEVGLGCTICADLAGVIARLPRAGCALVTEEALLAADRTALSAWVQQQPPWSDFPFVLLTSRGASPDGRLVTTLGNVTVLERPFHPAVLANAAKSALRARARQHEVESHQARQVLLIAELNHRVKNTLATVQSLAHQSLRRAVCPDRARERFEARLLSLSRTHNLLNETSWAGASLREVVVLELAPYVSDQPQRLAACGPDLDLPAPMALALGMIFHELATNAAKYGSLSHESGRVGITWAIAELSSAARLLRIRWKERGGPNIAEPLKRGFGSRLIEQTSRHQLNGRAHLRFEPEGLIFELEVPLAAHDASEAAAAQ